MNITLEVENEEKALLPLFLGIMIFLAGCDYSTPEKQDDSSLILLFNL